MATTSTYPGVTPKAIRRVILEQAKRAHVGHIGSALSVADILAALFSRHPALSEYEENEENDVAHADRRDRFVLSKGHAALALYAALHLQGRLEQADLDSYCGNGGYLGVHPEKALAGVDFSSGSLGQGLSTGAGAALAMRLKGSQGRVRVLMSDAELNEGSTWEAIMFAAHWKLANLEVILDLNGQQAMGRTRDVLDLAPLVPRWEAFGWAVREADGHDLESLHTNLDAMANGCDRPQVLLAKTVSGKGVSFMESQVKWHYWPLSESDYATAMAEVEAAA